MLILQILWAILACNGPQVTFQHYTGDWYRLVDGYCIEDPGGNQFWIEGLVDDDYYREMQSPDHFITRALYQRSGIPQETARINQIVIPEGYEPVALNFPADKGRTGWVRISGQEWHPIISVDAAAREHLIFHADIVESGIELSYELAQELNMPIGGIWGLEVCLRERSDLCAENPEDYTMWFNQTLILEGE